jgi:hypothetical protein
MVVAVASPRNQLNLLEACSVTFGSFHVFHVTYFRCQNVSPHQRRRDDLPELWPIPVAVNQQANAVFSMFIFEPCRLPIGKISIAIQ